MKKNLAEILAVTQVFKSLTTKHFSNFSISYKIAKASKELDEHTKFYSEEERKLVTKYAVKDEKGQVKILDGNRISFKDQEDAMNFNKEIIALQQTEVDVFDPIEINFKDFKNNECDLTPADIIALEGFIDFVDGEKPTDC